MGLRQSLARTAALLLAIVHTRLELFSLELDEQKGQLLGLLVLALAACLFAVFGILLVSLGLVLHFWPAEHRGLGLVLLALVYLLLAGALFFVLRRRLAHMPAAFSGSLDELRQDAARLGVLGRAGARDASDQPGWP